MVLRLACGVCWPGWGRESIPVAGGVGWTFRPASMLDSSRRFGKQQALVYNALLIRHRILRTKYGKGHGTDSAVWRAPNGRRMRGSRAQAMPSVALEHRSERRVAPIVETKRTGPSRLEMPNRRWRRPCGRSAGRSVSQAEALCGYGTEDVGRWFVNIDSVSHSEPRRAAQRSTSPAARGPAPRKKQRTTPQREAPAMRRPAGIAAGRVSILAEAPLNSASVHHIPVEAVVLSLRRSLRVGRPALG